MQKTADEVTVKQVHIKDVSGLKSRIASLMWLSHFKSAS